MKVLRRFFHTTCRQMADKLYSTQVPISMIGLTGAIFCGLLHNDMGNMENRINNHLQGLETRMDTRFAAIDSRMDAFYQILVEKKHVAEKPDAVENPAIAG
ncbi:hypothetical protein H072_8810 [Dactylellina haptotyla CBS 200.50]|uniref:Uncharacterized protein n=1 Tax=Dactylellina haptotyla (strain CBS 200.50) TaxID=1284197 RepID=S8A3Y8_DACHA|nr:hypothetical protein H072_8810 [Dactylellina haptotyla CBS 200.50]